MNYTMTMDMPQREAMFVRRSPRLRKELIAILRAVIVSRMQYEPESDSRVGTQHEGDMAIARWDELVMNGHGRLEHPYQFNRADAYDEDIG